MTEVFEVPPQMAGEAHVDDAKYLAMYKQSVEDPEGFWGAQIDRLTWYKTPTKVRDVSYEGDVHIRWFEDGELNVAYNCIDRHLEKRGDQTAIIFEGDSPDVDARITYRQLHEQVCRLSNVLRDQGVKKGDRVMIYMRWFRRRPTRCSRVPESARFTRWSLVASRRTHSQTESKTQSPAW